MTGASSGLGARFTRVLGARGADLYLLSAASDHVAGSVLTVDGGQALC